MSTSCSLEFPDCERTDWELEPFGDISGLGVVIGFVATGYLTFVLLICYYFVVYDPEEGTVEGEKFKEGRIRDADILLHPRRLNKFDAMAIKSVRTLFRKMFKGWTPFAELETDWKDVLSLSILNMCDAQILTGLAIIISGFLSLKCSTSHLSAYHWQMIVNLAWFACITQLSGLTVIRFYLQDRPIQRNVRFGLMTLLFVLVLAGLIPMGYFDWNANDLLSAAQPAAPAICFFPSNNRRSMFNHDFCRPHGTDFLDCAIAGPTSAQGMVFSACLLGYGYITRSIKLYKPFSRAMHSFIRDPCSQWYRNAVFKLAKWGDPKTTPGQLGTNLLTRLVVVPLFAIFLCLRVYVDMITSMLAEAYWLLVVLLWGTFRLAGSRTFNEMPQSVIDDENQWTFGQLLPVLLLISPIFNTFGLFLARTTHIPPPPMIENMEMGSAGASSQSLARPPKDLTRPLARAQISRLVTMDIAPQSWTDRDYYIAGWMPGVIGALCCACFWTPGIAASYLFAVLGELKPHFSPFRFWVLDFGGLWYILLGLPSATIFSISCGLGLHPWFGAQPVRLWKKWTFFALGLCMVMVYTFTNFFFSMYFWDVGIRTSWQKELSHHDTELYSIPRTYSITFPAHIVAILIVVGISYASYALSQIAHFIWMRSPHSKPG